MALAALVLFGLAALLTGRDVHLALAALAFAATALVAVATFRGAAPSRPAPLRDYVTLTKPRIMSLLLLTGGAGVFVGARRRAVVRARSPRRWSGSRSPAAARRRSTTTSTATSTS